MYVYMQVSEAGNWSRTSHITEDFSLGDTTINTDCIHQKCASNELQVLAGGGTIMMAVNNLRKFSDRRSISLSHPCACSISACSKKPV